VKRQGVCLSMCKLCFELGAKSLFFNMIFWACMYALKTIGLSIHLLRLPMMVHWVRFGYRYAHFEKICSVNLWLYVW
jgi:hypothetical protein